jgi:hypothetical protein
MALVEQLEGRRLLAGDVAAAFDGEFTLTITGDAQSNQMTVSTDINGTTVTPLQGTTVNGSAEPALFPYADVVVIDTGNGDDHVELTAFDLQDCYVNTGNGSDTVAATGSNLFFDLYVDTGAGSDDVTVSGMTTLDGDMRIDTGTGKDRVTIAGDLSVKSDDIVIAGGNGVDVLDRSGFAGNLPAAGIIDIELLIA